MKALILAGGYGTRLRPLTCSRPKQLLPLTDSTLIGYILNQLRETGIKEVVLATGQNTDSLQSELGDGSQHGITLHFSQEPHPLGTAGAIKFAEPYLPEKTPFLVLNGDIVSNIPYHHLIHYHHEHQAMATIALYRVADPSRYGVVDITVNGLIQRFVEKPRPAQAPSNLINAGCYILNHAVLDQIPTNQVVSLEYDVFPVLCQSHGVFGWEHHGFWVDTGTPASFLEAHQTIRSQMHKTPFVGSETRIAKLAKIEPTVTIGNHVVIGAHSQISNSIIFNDAVIGEGTIIDSSIVGQGAQIGNNLHLEAHTIVGDGAILDTGAIIESGALVCPGYHVEKGEKPPYCFVKHLIPL
ncbi:MAG: sugar phosphate nucleotidyltransferase [Promethearchaeota archaeon]